MLWTTVTSLGLSSCKPIYYIKVKSGLKRLQIAPIRMKHFTLKACVAIVTTQEAERNLRLAANIQPDLTMHLDYVRTVT